MGTGCLRLAVYALSLAWMGAARPGIVAAEERAAWEAIKAGDRVVVKAGPAPAMDGARKVTELETRTELTAHKVHGPWVQVEVIVDKRPYLAWVDASKHLCLVNQRPASPGATDQKLTPGERAGRTASAKPEYPFSVTALIVKFNGDGEVEASVRWASHPGTDAPPAGPLMFAFLIGPRNPVPGLLQRTLAACSPLGKGYLALTQMGGPGDFMRFLKSTPEGMALAVFCPGGRGTIDWRKPGECTFVIPAQLPGAPQAGDWIVEPGMRVAVGVFRSKDPRHDPMQSTEYAPLSNIVACPIGEAHSQ